MRNLLSKLQVEKHLLDWDCPAANVQKAGLNFNRRVNLSLEVEIRV